MKLLVGLLLACQSLLVTASTTDSAPLTTPSVVPKPTNFTYPWPVQYFDLNSQQQRLSMAYMDVSPKKPNGRAAVLLHGKNFCGATWEVTARALLDAGYRVVLPDQIGFCKSSKPKYQFSFQQLASNTKNLLSHVGLGNTTVAVIGHSMGGMLATRYALMHPNQTAPLVLINPLGLEDWKAIGVPWRSIDDLYNDELRQNFTTIKAYQQSTYYVNTWKPEYDIWVKMLDDIYHGPERHEFSYDTALVTDMVLSQPVVYEFPLLKMKTLLLIGEKDNTAIGKAWAPESIKPLLGRYDLLGNQTVAKIPKAHNSLQIDVQIPLSQELGASAPPLLGFGTWNLRGSAENTTNAVAHAIKTGYRHIDCAAAYSNQIDVGRGIKEGLAQVSGLTRQDLWITSKLWNDHHGSYDIVEKGLNQTLLSLGQEYLDLYLMHWPVGNPNGTYGYDYLETWQSMEKLLTTGRVRNIGICNFSPSQLTHLIAQSAIKPHSHQMELHPYLQQTDFVQWHHENDIHVIAYSPLGNMNPTYHKKKHAPPLLLENGYVQRVAKKRDATPAQVVLAWGMGRGISVIPKSSHASFIEENFGSLNVELKKKDLKTFKKVGKRYLTRFNNPSDGWGIRLFGGLDDA